MNILPKKSWHVRNKDNIAKVRRDEENARLEEEKLAKRAALAEQEARTKLLRDRVHGSLVDGTASEINDGASSSMLPYGETQTGHINLFEQEEIGGTSLKATNAEYEAEKKAEQEKKEKALGVLKYLGQSVADEGGHPWYAQKRKNVPEMKKSDEADRKKRLDPLEKMNAFLVKTKKSDDKKKQKKDKQKTDRHKKERKEKKEPKSTNKRTIEELRAERLQREKQERFRAEKLIQDAKKGTSSGKSDEEDPYSSSSRRYHSQYNPDFARKPKFSRYQPY